MAQEFKVKNGLIVDQGGATITGSVIATGGFTGSLFGTASNAVSSSFVTTASFATLAQTANTASYISPSLIFPYTGSALITGSLIVTGSLVASGSSHLLTATNNIDLKAPLGSINFQSPRVDVYAPTDTIGVTDHLYLDSNTTDSGVYFSQNDEVIASFNTTNGRYSYGDNNLFVSSSDNRTYSPSGFVGPLLGTASYAATASLLTGRLSTYRSSGTGSMVGTGTTSLTATTSFLIPANTFTTGDILRVRYRVRKLATNANTTTGIYINTTNDISTATTLGILTANTTSMQMKRDFYILSATGINTEHVGVGTSLATDDAATGRAASTIDWSVDQYMIFGITHTNTSDSGYSTMYYLERV